MATFVAGWRSVEGAVSVGVVSELGEAVVEGGQVEVEDVDAVPEVFESELFPYFLEGGDCQGVVDWVLFGCVG